MKTRHNIFASLSVLLIRGQNPASLLELELSMLVQLMELAIMSQ